jgi:hypothetical protein
MAFNNFRRNEVWKSVGMAIAFSIALSSPVSAADCSANVNACIDANKNKPNAVAKWQAAGATLCEYGYLCWTL